MHFTTYPASRRIEAELLYSVEEYSTVPAATMDTATMTMDKSTTPELRVHREENFRIPTETERSLALWVDRVGRITDTKRLDRLRILGQYCHIFVLEGEGEYRSTRWGQLPVRAGDCMVQFPDDPCLYHPDSTWTSCWVTWNGPEAAQIHETGYLAQRSPVFRDTGRAVAKAYEQRIIELDKEFASQGYPVLAINSNDPGMVYIGAIDDNQRKPESVKNAYVKEAIQALESGKKPKTTETMAVGCAIKYRK